VTEVFADTFFYLALLSRESASRARAQAVAAALRARTVTTGFVLLEVANSLSARAHRGAYVELARRLAASRTTTVLPASADLFERGQSLYAARADKDWSLTDCTSFVVMQDRAITQALTGDHHFEQAGFVPLLKP
jgi:predicted nucleic acid-binding protein